ncbi:MAG: hypothetical protein ABW003_26175 [Microvirga sp.]
MSQNALRLAATAAFALIQQPAFSLDTMESIGAEKCGRAAKAYDIQFLAPDNATVEAKVKAGVKGAPDNRSESATLSLDGTECTGGRCGFEAKKGQLSARTSLTSLDELCIVVARP